MATPSPIVTGRIVFTKKVFAFTDATIHIQLEDVSIADAEACILAEETITNVQHHPDVSRNGFTTVPFKIFLKGEEEIDPRNLYAIRVWVDISSDGKNDADDLNSDQSLRVLTQGFGNSVDVSF